MQIRTTSLAVDLYRVSATERRPRGLGPEAQQATVRNFVAGQDWTLVTEVSDIAGGKDTTGRASTRRWRDAGSWGLRWSRHGSKASRNVSTTLILNYVTPNEAFNSLLAKLASGGETQNRGVRCRT